MSYILLIPISNNINFQSTIIIHNHHTHQQYGTTHQFNLNHSSSIYHNMHFLTYHTIKASIFIITHMITSYISTIPQHHQFNAYLRASSLSISYHITYQIRETETIPQPIFPSSTGALPNHLSTSSQGLNTSKNRFFTTKSLFQAFQNHQSSSNIHIYTT